MAFSDGICRKLGTRDDDFDNSFAIFALSGTHGVESSDRLGKSEPTVTVSVDSPLIIDHNTPVSHKGL